ncbi:MAG: DUF5723 family protein [Saprospiraceae bacterium]|nr:DUF5723 family protein [Saprospiraceae bacterium]|tara:strand:- start:353 stop:1753 length:1401 start_codon:yes stop_codon:yes gene_type:complete
MWRFIFSILIVLFIGSQLKGQASTGLYHGPNAGINGVFVNPASARSYPMLWDVNIASFSIFGHTDYVFVKETNLFHFVNNVNNLSRLPLDPEVNPTAPDRLFYDFPLRAFTTKGSANLEINGPGVLYNLENLSVGLFSRLRAIGGSHSIPSSLSYFGVQSSFVNIETISGKASASGLYWSEYGISLSTDQLIPIEELSIGINIKYNRAHQGANLKSFDEFSYNRLSSDSLIVFQPQFEFGITSITADDPSPSLAANGSGIGVDIGVSKTLSLGTINFSILDIGSVKVKNAEVYTLQSSQDLSIDTDAIQNAGSIRNQIIEIDQQISSQLDRIQTIQSGSQFSIGLPTRIHLDFTYDFKKNRSVLLSIDQRVPIFSNSLEAENVVTIAPRYENKWWMLTTPISIYEYSKIRVGLAARIGLLTIGTDHLASLIGKSDFRGSSIYAGVRLFPFWKVNRRNNNVNCPLPE